MGWPHQLPAREQWISKDETLLSHAISGDSAGGVGSNRDVTVDNRGAVELGE